MMSVERSMLGKAFPSTNISDNFVHFIPMRNVTSMERMRGFLRLQAVSVPPTPRKPASRRSNVSAATVGDRGAKLHERIYEITHEGRL